MERRTHLALSARLCGEARSISSGAAELELEASDEMRADARGLVHGGFIFGLADHAAMLAINEPNVVLGSAQTRFVAPVVVGDKLRASARVTSVEGKRQQVEVKVTRAGSSVFEGTFVCFVPPRHVLEGRVGGGT